jgi:general secretion pathway protein A
MYCELFQLNEPPFRLTPDPQFLFASKQHSRAKAFMESTIWLTDGFVVVTGEIGSGKTTLIESFLSELPDDVVLAQISQTQLSPVEFLQALLVEFGYEPFRMKKIELLAILKDYMIRQYADGKKLLLIVDEAQNLSRRVLEEIRMLSGIEAQKEKLLRIILAGQPELSQKLDSPELEQLTQRVRLRFHLGALSKRETREYIEHRLEVAGANGRQIFGDDTYDLIYSYTGGIPRLTNILCDTALLCGFAEERSTIDTGLVEAAVEELQWVRYVERKKVNGATRPPPSARPAVESSLARFEIYFNDDFLEEFVLPLGRAIIGRTADNDLQIRSKFISRHHAQVISGLDQSIVEDLNSTNGMFFHAQRIKQHVLRDGDVLQLGEHRLVYRDLRAGAGAQHLEATDRRPVLDVQALDLDAEPDAADEAESEDDEPQQDQSINQN